MTQPTGTPGQDEPVPGGPAVSAMPLGSGRAQPFPNEEDIQRPSLSKGFYARSWDKFRTDRLSMAAGFGLGIVLLITLLGPIYAEHIMHTSPEEIRRTPDGRVAVLQPPSSEFPLGTDGLGRDALTRLLYA